MNARTFAPELIGKVDPALVSVVNRLFEAVYKLQESQSRLITPTAVKQQLIDLGLLNILGQPVLGLTGSDPQLSSLPVSPGTGTVTNVTGSGDSNVTTTITNSTTTPNVGVTLSLTPTLTTVSVGVGGYKVSGTKVVGAQGAVVPDAAGGATIDAEARTAINDLLARLRDHGLIAT
jgi:hypothetical protein